MNEINAPCLGTLLTNPRSSLIMSKTPGGILSPRYPRNMNEEVLSSAGTPHARKYPNTIKKESPPKIIKNKNTDSQNKTILIQPNEIKEINLNIITKKLERSLENHKSLYNNGIPLDETPN